MNGIEHIDFDVSVDFAGDSPRELDESSLIKPFSLQYLVRFSQHFTNGCLSIEDSFRELTRLDNPVKTIQIITIRSSETLVKKPGGKRQLSWQFVLGWLPFTDDCRNR